MQIIKIRKGLNIPINGVAEKNILSPPQAATVAIKPSDFTGFNPKLLVAACDRVLAGSPLFYNKTNDKIIITSPVSGQIAEIVRGEKRVILEILINCDQEIAFQKFKQSSEIPSDREAIISLLLQSGLWAFIRQRPFDVIPDPLVLPRDIYISTFDSAPLAPDYAFVLKESGKYLQAAIDTLSKLTSGKLHLGLNANASDNTLFEDLKGTETHYFKGPHPAGNVGVQIHHTKPINKGETVWYLNIQDVAMIGKLMLEGVFDATRVIAVTGPEVSQPKYVKTCIGASVRNLFELHDPKNAVRVISGNVLTGTSIEPKGNLGFYDHQLTLIPEGNYYEFLGWATPGFKKLSHTKTFLSKLLPPKDYKIDTNYHGGERAFVMSGQYEKVFPFDIYPVYLVKAIITDDIDKMEQLGIYEVSPEDFALCDFVCTSKIEAQEIVRNGLEKLRKEMV
jgi:Na+-transporting NADH:ubiquinone oxidoreductase subunit A